MAGCGVIPAYTYRNKRPELMVTYEYLQTHHGVLSRLVDGRPQVDEFSTDEFLAREQASWDVKRASDTRFAGQPFIGIAVSGGGSRAASFAASVFEELETVRILPRATAISSVSGGSLAAAYYAARRNRPEWSWSAFRAAMAKDFFGWWLARLLVPGNVLRAWFTDYDRTDALADVFDSLLFEGATFAQLGEDGPRLFINATDLTARGERFVFSVNAFLRLGSALPSYPIAHAVAASGAFPGLLNSVTLRRFARRNPFDPDQHLIAPEEITDPTGLARRILAEETKMASALRARLMSSGESESDENDTALRKILATVLSDRSWASRLDLLDAAIQRADWAREKSFNYFEIDELHRDLLRRRYSAHVTARSASVNAGPRYVHLIDGGPADNLGVDTLREAARHYYSNAPGEHRCLLIVVDAYVRPSATRLGDARRDRRRWYDSLIDTNAWDAADSMLRARRARQLEELGLRETAADFESSLEEFVLVQSRRTTVKCLVWHVSLSRLPAFPKKLGKLLSDQLQSNVAPEGFPAPGGLPTPLKRHRSEVHALVDGISTQYRLVDERGCSVEELQTVLAEAARMLVRDDLFALEKISEAFPGLLNPGGGPIGLFDRPALLLRYPRGGQTTRSACAPMFDWPATEIRFSVPWRPGSD